MQGEAKLERFVVWATVAAAILFAVIGVRFLVAPESAARSFGLAEPIARELHRAVGLRDLWLALLALALVSLREWRALALWFGIGSLVCFADAGIVAVSSSQPWAIAFHTGAGLIFAALAWVWWRLASRSRQWW